jgi:hypothetical protein
VALEAQLLVWDRHLCVAGLTLWLYPCIWYVLAFGLCI